MNEKGNIIIWVSLLLMVLSLSAMLVITTATLGLKMRKDDEKVKQAVYLAEGVVDLDFALLADELMRANEVANSKILSDQLEDEENYVKTFKNYFNNRKVISYLNNKKNYKMLMDKEIKVDVKVNERVKWINSSKDYLIPIIIEVIYKNVKKVIKVDFIISIPGCNTSNEELVNFIKIENYRYDNNEK